MTANTMRSQLAGWDPDEEEFLAVFDLRKEFDDEFGAYLTGSEDAEEAARRSEAEQALEVANSGRDEPFLLRKVI